ncbi:MAG: hypothetical protein KAJ10_07475, partial [Thermodesulfovibrionia bacterium]|nr:hypothetical protein [Thermodesulfovibrionia bacterium]
MKKNQRGAATTTPETNNKSVRNSTNYCNISISDTLKNQKKWINKLQSLQGNKPILIKCLEGSMPPGADPDLYNWMYYKDVMYKATQPVYTRGTLPFEIVIDFDVKDWNILKSEGDKLISFLRSANIPYLLAYSGGNGVHVHIFMQPLEFNMPDLQGYDVDVAKAVRQSVCAAILQDANVNPADIGLDKKKINFSKDGKGSQVREFGTTRPDGRYKTLINEIPTEWPQVNPPLIFPAEVLIWNITGTKYNDIAREAVKDAIEKAKKGNVFILNDVDFVDTNPTQYPCINKLMTQGLDNGRYYGAGALIL